MMVVFLVHEECLIFIKHEVKAMTKNGNVMKRHIAKVAISFEILKTLLNGEITYHRKFNEECSVIRLLNTS